MSGDRLSVVAAVGCRGTDQWISRAAAATVAGLAGIAGALSYSHMRQLAADHGQAGWHAHAFPLSVDGIELVASLVLLADRRAGRRSGWLPWAALIIGTAASLAANTATAEPGAISRLIAGWPALALLIAVKLLSGMLDHHAAHGPAVPDTIPSRSPGSGTGNGDDHVTSRHVVPISSRPASAPARPASHYPPGLDHAANTPSGTTDPSPAAPGTVPGLTPGLSALLPAARAAREGLHRDGRPLTRDALAARLRQSGHPVRNSRLTPLLHTLRTETTTPPPDTDTAA